MTRVLVVVLVLAAALAGGAASASSTDVVHAIVWQGRTMSLATLDATSFEPRGRLFALGRAQGSVSTDRRGDTLAIASAGTGIAVVDTRRMKVLWRLDRGRLVRSLSWVSPTRLLVLEHGGVLLLDTAKKRIVARAEFDGLVLASHRWARGVVVLAFPNEGSIEPARLVVVGPGVRVRTVELSRVAAGWASGPTTTHDFNRAQPGLAVDAGGGRAFVAGGPHLATIDLSSLGVSYSGSERALQKLSTGPRRSAVWLGSGLLAVAGADDRLVGDTVTTTPLGLRFVTPDGVRLIDDRVTDVRAAAGLVLAYGHRYTSGRYEGAGLAAYDRAGTLRWRLFDDASIGSVPVAAGRAYVSTGDGLSVVELATGQILAAVARPWRTFIVGGD